ncbi:Ankyrin repeat domain-containing protein [Candidatus Megaera polyxenophila]|nr:Ankyrin repeat domain-containing protein [Candidatus Megaera polyxenophila]
MFTPYASASYVHALQAQHTTANLRNHDYNVSELNKSPKLHVYAKKGNIKKILNLVQSGVDVNEANCEKETAIHIAAKHKKVASIQLLIYLGANTKIKDSYGNTARDLLKDFPVMLSKFDSFKVTLHQHNIQVIVNILQKVKPYLPNEICHIIANYSVNSEGPWLEYDSSLLEEVVLSGNVGPTHACCSIS